MAAPTTFSKTQITLHWLIAALVLFQVLLHDGIVETWGQRMDGTIPNVSAPNPHAIAGILIFVLMIWRLIVRLRLGAPEHPVSDVTILGPAADSPIVTMLSKATHILFYVLLLAMPISGAAAWFLGIELPANAHSLAANILVPLIILHFFAAMAHHFLLKTNVLKRMLGMN